MENIKFFHKPTISESLGNGWFTTKKYFLWLFLAIVVCAIVNGPNIQHTMKNQPWNGNWHEMITPAFATLGIAFALLALVSLAIFFLVRPVIFYGSDMMFVQAARDQKPDLQLLFKGFKINFLNIILSNLIKTIILAIGFVMLLIPGIVFACRLAFVSYLVMDKNLDPIRAIEESWRLTKGYGWTIFGLGILSFFICIIGLAMLIVGIFPAIILINSTFASLYQAILTQKENNSLHSST
ncbi:MAG TPA: hypothetical protein PLS94_06910 [Prolixibacteraceae bacterium]|nr:hypothetical protein [Prolixibacteraceae bacterium]HPR60216.1 hypothetical protein [Prolixibacteraceae bacterium]